MSGRTPSGRDGGSSHSLATTLAALAAVGGVAVATYMISKTDTPIGHTIRDAFTPPRASSGTLNHETDPAKRKGTSQARRSQSNNSLQHSQQRAYSGAGGMDRDGPPPGLPFDTTLNAEMCHWVAPNRLISDVIAPVAGVVGPRPVIAAVGGLGSRLLAARVARMLPLAQLIVTDSEPQVRTYLAAQASRAGLTNVTVTPGGPTRASLPAGIRASMLLLVGAYYALGNGSSADRIAWLRNTVAADLDLGRSGSAAHVGGGGTGVGTAYVIIVEARPGRLPAPLQRLLQLEEEAEAAGGSLSLGIPPEDERVERSTILAEAAQAGLELVSAPAVLECFYILVFRVGPPMTASASPQPWVRPQPVRPDARSSTAPNWAPQPATVSGLAGGVNPFTIPIVTNANATNSSEGVGQRIPHPSTPPSSS